VSAVLQDAVAKLSENMALAGFPVIRMSGLFQLPCVPCPVFLYNVMEAVGRPLRRTFPGLRKIKQIWPQPPETKVRFAQLQAVACKRQMLAATACLIMNKRSTAAGMI
jgi:hypothetical protein